MNQSDAPAHQEASTKEFHMGFNMSRAQEDAQTKAAYYASLLPHYKGPLAIAGGSVRDMALGRLAKDRDVFIDGGYIPDDEDPLIYMAPLAAGLGGYVSQVIPCHYGTWALDIKWVVKIAFAERPVGSLEPLEIDVVCMRRTQMLLAGYEPHAFLDPHTQASFLRAVLRRVDVRLNAIGASPVGTDSLLMWKHDALAQRLVVQRARWAEDGDRIAKRLARMTGVGGKYEGWAVRYEGESGDLVEAPLGATQLL